MSNQRPTLPRGTRDFGPIQMSRRNYLLSQIRIVFEKYGYQPIETPGMENLSVLMGKYGDEGDQLLYKILNSGNYLKDVKEEDYSLDSKKLLHKISEKGLRYDLTVPFARYVAQNQNDIELPFKRYQIQPVWRADRPQKGRYREFLQCDADVVGSNSPLNEAEIISMISEIFRNLKIKGYTIRLNHRKILGILSKMAGKEDAEGVFCTILDKLDKIGTEKVREELISSGFDSNKLDIVLPTLTSEGGEDNASKLIQLTTHFSNEQTDTSGIENLEEILGMVDKMKVDSKVVVDYSLARGLSYYTGAIIEVTIDDNSMGSLSGGGRYDNLTGVFGVPGIPGVGFSLGIDRIYEVMSQRGLFNQVALETTKVLLVTFDSDSFDFAIPIVSSIRAEGISAELYPHQAKMKKQMNYANRKNIPFVLFIGSEEISTGLLTLKTMESGSQKKLSLDDIIDQLKG